MTAGLQIGQISDRLSRFEADENDRPSDVLLKWHFHQSILSHMRGSGEVKDHKFEDELYQGSVDLSEDRWVEAGKIPLEGFFEHALQSVLPDLALPLLMFSTPTESTKVVRNRNKVFPSLNYKSLQ